jgi:hypothetical protein
MQAMTRQQQRELEDWLLSRNEQTQREGTTQSVLASLATSHFGRRISQDQISESLSILGINTKRAARGGGFARMRAELLICLAHELAALCKELGREPPKLISEVLEKPGLLGESISFDACKE